jgi:CheY-like chemotaxis protein
MSATGLKVFLVEDEAMIRMMVVDMLEELGHSIAAEAGHLDKALGLAQSTEFDVAILDVHLDGKLITPVAGLVADRGLPIFLQPPGEWDARPCKSRSTLKPWRPH